jgi:predicted house-cleaning noncanonical NTP pyrophosphatase (MazG superfamily)
VSPRQDPQVIWSQCLEPITHLAAAEEYAASLGDKLAEGVDEFIVSTGRGSMRSP